MKSYYILLYIKANLKTALICQCYPLSKSCAYSISETYFQYRHTELCDLVLQNFIKLSNFIESQNIF